MLISEVEHIVGLSKKSIRYYEKNGLLSPKRNSENDYRIYNEEDIRKLKVIKFLREINVSIRELKLLNENKITLNECMREQIKKIEREEDNYQKIKDMCIEILESNDTYENIDITKYFENVNILGKEGFTMRDTKTSKIKKLLGAITSSFIFIIFFISFIGIVTYFQINEESIPWLFYCIIVLIFGLPIIGIIYNLIVRIKEINGGEEDEASKY